MNDQQIILEDSPEAASIQTVTGWVDRHGRFWGEDERTARYCGSTHKVCSCGATLRKDQWCQPCRIAKDIEKFEKMPRQKWDGTGVIFSDARDEYFMDLEEAEDSLNEGETLESLRLIICIPDYLSPVSEDHFNDDLPEDGELDSDVSAALDALNEVIKNAGPSCWRPGKFALDLNA